MMIYFPKSLAGQTDVTNQQVRALFEDAGVETVRIDNEVYRENGLTPVDIRQSPAMRQTLEAGYRKTLGNMKNLTLTTANTSQTAYINAVNQAYMQVTSGAFSYQEAIRQAVQKTAQTGAMVTYPSGYTERIDVAVRRAVLTGVGQTCREIGMMNAEECGCDLMEISAHSGARPDHAKWQGKIVSLSGRKGYLSKSDIGYGTGDGFGGWNCRHDWFPFFEGYSRPSYSAKDLQKLDEKNIEYNGKLYSQYEISQIQRRYEREIRAAKREQVAFKTAVEEVDDPELKQVMQDSLDYSNALVKDRQAKMRDFIKQTGQNRDYFREQNYPKENLKNSLTFAKNSGIIEESRKNKHVQPINDISIRKVKALKGGAYSEEQNLIIQVKHKELLEFARDNNPEGECAFILSSEFNNQVNCVGRTSTLDFSSREAVNMLTYNRNLYVMHNHPKNSSFSTTDIIFLLQHDSVKTLSIVKHNGRIEQLTKSDKYSGVNALNDFWQMLNTVDRNQSIDNINKEYDKIVKEFVSKEWFAYEKT